MDSLIKKHSRLLKEVYPELLCGLCQDLLDEPIQVHCPEDHMFCRSCIHSYLNNNNTNCPQCQVELDTGHFQLSKFVQRQISRLRVHCRYAEQGCEWKGCLSEEGQHDCQYTPNCPCPNQGCHQVLAQHQLQPHLEVCDYTLLSCPNKSLLCLTSFLRRDAAHHEATCPSYPCLYAKEGCTFVGTRKNVDMHCSAYCGKLHDRIRQLEKECDDLNNVLKGLNQGQVDSAMSEMALFHQMFDSFDYTSPTTQEIPVNTIPKRSSSGKRIRYSKNKRLAHDALRKSRQQPNPTNDAILNNLDIAKKKAIENKPYKSTKPMFILASSYLSNYQTKQS